VTDAEAPDSEDLVPVSVRLGTVVPPEDPEDWTRPLTWVAALGMLAAPVVALAWYALAAPLDSTRALTVTWAVALALAVGAAAAGATQLGRLRAVTGTLGAALLAAVLVVGAGAVSPGGRQIGAASPTLAHSMAAALAGVAGAIAAAAVGGVAAGRLTRLWRGIVTGAVGALVTGLVLPRLFGG
jgi:hypothetical protein